MLPIVNPSDPSCSSSETRALRDDEKDYRQLASCEADPRVLGFDDSQTCNFSIRDYVFASRSKNILTSWPFPRQILKFCVKHGVRELLPPFEPPSSVRAHCCRRADTETQKISFDAYQAGDGLPLNGENKIAKSDSWLPSEDVSVKSLDDAVGVVISKSAKPVESARGECEISSIVTTPDIGKILVQVSEPVVKNSSSILDQIAAADLSRAEEIASTTTTVSDPMASKVCPVCKTFSSTSNTTLNAHMDQCLFMESDTNRVGEIVPKVKLKPRKKRLMDDIYATAPLCTLEDLDRRNGTSWAAGLAFVPPTIDTTTVAEEPNLLEEDTKDDEREGAVYVDSNGIKLRILSKFNDAPQLTSKEELWPSRNMDSVRDGKLLSMGKKGNLADKHTKKMKMKLKKRKLSSLKLLKDEICTPDVGHEETRVNEQEEPVVQLSSRQENVGIRESTSLRRWPCSKRSHLSKKIINKNFQKSLDSTKPVGGIPSHENNKSPSSFAANSHVTKFYRPSDSAVFDFTTKAVENQASQKESNPVRPLQGTSNIVRLKLPKSSENLVSSSEEFSVASKKFDNIPEANEKPTGSSLHSPKSKRFLNLSEANSMGKNFRKYSLMRTGKRKRVISDEYPGLQKPTNAVTDFPAKVLVETSLNPGYNQHQYSETRNSETLTEPVASSERRTASKKAGSICTVLQTCTENQSATRDAVIETSTVQLVEEDGQPTKQELHFRQDKQAVNEFSKTMSAQESSACLTSHCELMPDYLKDPIVQEDDNNLAIERELSGSPASSASTISPPSPEYSHLKPSYNETVTRPSVARNMMSLHSIGVSEGIQGTNVLNNCQILGDYAMRLHERSDYQPCCCIRQNILTTNLLTPPKEFPNFFSRSSISHLSESYSESRADTISTPVLESPTDSIMSRTCGDSASPNPSCGTPMQQTTGSVFRLMGKNLMVMNTEESDQLPKFLPPNTVNSSQGQALASSAFASYAGVPTHRSFSNTLKSKPPCEGLFCAKPTKMNQEARMTKDLIVANDHHDEDIAYRNDLPQVSVLGPMLQRPFPWFTSHGQHLPRDDGARPAFFINRGSSWKCPVSLLQGPVAFQSPASQLNASLHHVQSLR